MQQTFMVIMACSLIGKKDNVGKLTRRAGDWPALFFRQPASVFRKNGYKLAHFLPAIPYVKGFLHVYARYLMLDPKDILLQYENYLKSLIPPESILHPAPKKKSARAWFFLSLLS